MTEQPRLLDGIRRASEAARPIPRPEPSEPPTEALEPAETMMAGVLSMARWESKVRLGRRIWRDPSDPFSPWYSEEMAYGLVEKGEA